MIRSKMKELDATLWPIIQRIVTALTGVSAFFLVGIYSEFRDVSAKLDVVIVQQAVIDQRVSANAQQLDAVESSIHMLQQKDGEFEKWKQEFYRDYGHLLQNR